MFSRLLVVIGFVVIANAKGACGHPDPFTRQGNRYERSVTFEIVPQEEPGPSDYLQTMITLIESQKNGEAQAVDANQFNRSDDGLSQYYQSLAYDYYLENNKPEVLIENWADPICMPNVTSNASDDFDFFKVKAFGFPAFKKNARAFVEIDPNPYVKDVNIHLNGTSDVTIFNGYFKVFDETFYFVYHTSTNVYHSILTKVRTTNALVKPKLAKYYFDFQSEVFVHTCDSTHERFADINATLYLKFQKALQEHYLPKLAVIADAKFLSNSELGSLELGKKYREKLVPVIVQAADQFLRLKAFFKTEFSRIEYVRRGKPLSIYYRTVFDGILNYERWELSNSSKKVAKDSLLAMENTIIFYYPETGEKQGSLTVITSDVKQGQIEQKFAIKSITIEIAYKANITSFPVHVYRDLERWMFTKSGFYARIEVYKPQDFYDFAIRHAGKEIAMGLGWVQTNSSSSSK